MNHYITTNTASHQSDEFLKRCRDIKNTLTDILESQKVLRRKMMYYGSRTAAPPTVTRPARERTLSPEILSGDEEEELNSVGSEEGEVSSSDFDEENGDEEKEGASYDEDETDEEEMTEAVSSHESTTTVTALSNPAAVEGRRNSERLSVWKCEVCKKQIRGDWCCRRSHIATHEKITFFCPVAECPTSTTHFNWRDHLKREHNTTRDMLPSSEKAVLQAQLDQFNEAAMNYEMKYFPPTSFICFSETAGKDGVKPFCKECGARCTQLQNRRDHVAIELKLKMDCPVRGCPYEGRYGAFLHHLTTKHGKQIQDLSSGQRERFKNARQKLYKKVDTEMHKFFSQ
uniref:C2H2-type domain-containing protein n=1 Tax=Steinernema glaseri TaxID=37863 RepID=A0A1I7Y5Q9_9BILA